jgi:hypothetical protein
MVDTRLGKRLLPVNITLSDGRVVSFDVNFPLADGTVMVQGPLTYNSDGLSTQHSVSWMSEPAFGEAYRRGMATGHKYGDDLHIEWRVHAACWAATLATHLEGDFVECGVNTGIYAAAICSYIDFNRFPDRHFYLLDTYEGFPTEQWSSAETANAQALTPDEVYFDTFELVRKTFEEYGNVVLVKGVVPDTLPLVPSERIAYLSIDMNAAVPERAALEFYWDRVVSGGVCFLDDYAFRGHEEQRRSFDEFAHSRNVKILAMPSGNGILIKP